MTISVFGLGKLGFPMAKFLKFSKLKVKGYEKNLKIRKLIEYNEKNYLIYENKIHSKKYFNKKIEVSKSALSSLIDTKICFITVPTPSDKYGDFSNKYLIECLNQIGAYIKKFYKSNDPYVININSTVSPGSFHNLLIPTMVKIGLKENKDFQFIYNPYFVALGEVASNLENPNFILIGCDTKFAKEYIVNIYKTIYKKPNFKFLSLKEAELTKILLNCYVTTKISFTNFVNELAINANISNCSKILDALGSDERIGKKYLNKGGPYSGPCFPRDNLALINYCKKTRTNFSIPKSTEMVNKHTIDDYKKKLKCFKKKFDKIFFLGIGYKKNTGCLDHSIAMILMEKAKQLGFKVYFYDKYSDFNDKKYVRCKSIDKVSKKSNLFFISYKDEEFKKINLKNKVVWDIYDFI